MAARPTIDDLEVARGRWSGRTAVVTGAAGGLGLGFAEVLDGIDVRVVRCDVDAAGLSATAGRHEDVVAPVDAARTMLAQVAAGRFAVTSHPDWARALADQRADRLRSLL